MNVEVGVLIAQRWIVACLRSRVLFTLEELNAAIVTLLDRLNDLPFQKLEGCRRSGLRDHRQARVAAAAGNALGAGAGRKPEPISTITSTTMVACTAC